VADYGSAVGSALGGMGSAIGNAFGGVSSAFGGLAAGAVQSVLSAGPIVLLAALALGLFVAVFLARQVR